jgi:putative ABC transport system permease protein
MLNNYIKIAWRQLRAQPFYSLVNIGGLAIGISACLLIALLVQHELSYDRFNEQAGDIYRLAEDLKFNGEQKKYAFSPSLLSDALISEVPEVIDAVRFRTYGPRLLRKDGTVQNVQEDRVTHVDHQLFDIFTIPITDGDAETVLKEPNTLVLTASAAEKYFGNSSPVGQNMILDNRKTYRVDGVCEDIPVNSHFHFDVFLSTAGLDELQNTMWLSNNVNTYLLTRLGTDQDALTQKVNAVFHQHAEPDLQDLAGMSIAEFEAAGNFIRYDLQPLTSIHLQSNLVGEHEVNGNLTYVWIFVAVALFILLIGCINFMNLSTARSAHRAMEVGMRKVLGSGKKELVRQFLTESTLMTTIAFGLAIGISYLLLPAFNELTDKTLRIPITDPIFLSSIGIGVVAIGLLSGSYPAFFLANFKPLKVIKGKGSTLTGGTQIRRVLVTAQFTISIVLMIATGVIYKQLQYMQKERLGFEREQVMILDANSLPGSIESLQNELEVLPEIQHLTATCYLPVDSYCRNGNAVWEKGKNPATDGVNTSYWYTNYGYIETLGMSMAEGRFFSEDYASDSTAIVVNEACVSAFGWDDPLNKQIQVYQGTDEVLTLSVIGVVKDFNYDNLRSSIEPLVLQLDTDASSKLIMRFDAQAGVRTFVEKVKNIWEATAPGLPFQYSFLDAQFDAMYEADQQLGQVFTIFAGLAIFIACLGLLALAAYTSERRKKEIGVRKVLGASIGQLVALLSKEFILLVAIALVLAIPIAWYGMHRWLENFAYRVTMSWWLFALAGMLAVSIALLTVSVQSIKAALANPVKSLKRE